MAVFRKTVDDFVGRMVYAPSAIELRSEMSTDAPIHTLVKPGAVMLIEEEHDTWLRVRQPSSTDTGWLRRKHIQFIDEQHARSN